MDLQLLDANIFAKKLKEWLQDIAAKCHSYALKNDVDFYVFQSAVPQKPNPDLLVIGINPGGHVSYAEAMKKQGKEKRSWQDLSQGCNTYSRKPCWEKGERPTKGNDVMRKVLVGTHDYDGVQPNEKCIFFNEKLFTMLDHAVVMNMYYFNTAKESDLAKMCRDEELQYCKRKTLELIAMLNPKNILLFTTSKTHLNLMGVKRIKPIGSFVQSGELAGKTVYAIPHPSGWPGFWNRENRISTGEMLDKIFCNQ